jgi:hypothetical protein
VTLSNFLTNTQILNVARYSLSAILSDLQPGAVVMVIGAGGAHYPTLYADLDELVRDCGLKRRIVDVRVSSGRSDVEIILAAARSVAGHIAALSPMTDDVPTNLRTALREGEEWGGTSSVRVYRRNRWPIRSHVADQRT